MNDNDTRKKILQERGWVCEEKSNKNKSANIKHCHFSILYNELPFLKQKLPFLYENFDQLIFFDLNVGGKEFQYSTDGSHEYIKNYPDLFDKITLIEEKDLSKITRYTGVGSIEKQKMFALGSAFVKNDIDIFWCTDMDEFFNGSLIKKVESIFKKDEKINCIDLNHYVFWKSFSYILSSKGSPFMRLPTRICRHKAGNLYGHCDINAKYPKRYDIQDEVYYHFAWIGDTRIKNKFKFYSGGQKFSQQYSNYLEKVWNKFQDLELEEGELYGYPCMHPNYSGQKMGIKKFDTTKLPSYINQKQLLKNLNNTNE